MKRHYERELAADSYHWDTQHDGLPGNEAIQVACLADIAKTMRRIERSLNSLGGDGIHQLIKLALKQARRKERRQKKPGRPKLRVA